MIKIPAPNGITVGARTYLIQVTPNLIADWGDRGQCSNRQQLILIEEKQRPVMKTATMIHEWLHAIGAVYLGDEHFVNEQQLESLANGLHQILQGMGIEIDWEKSSEKTEG